MVGMWLAGNVPERVDRLVLCCTAPSLPPSQQWVDRAAVVRADGVAAIAEATLVVSGSDDVVAPPDSGAALAAAIPGARQVVVRDAAHIANVEQPRAFTEAVIEHLTG
jgi:pimeloyl-ACP methyl ester carboxylesterase